MRSSIRKSGSIVAAFVAFIVSGCETAQVDLGPVANPTAAEAIRTAFSAGAKEASTEKAARPVGTGWATLKGQFVFDGNAPAMPTYNVTKEPEVCKVNGQSPPQETLLVDPGTKGLRNVVIYLREASRVHDSAKKQQPVVFDQKHCVFLTHVAAVLVGTSVEIKNSDAIGHNTNIVGTGFNPTVPGNGSVPYPVQKETSVPNEVKCGIHPWMTAYMLQRKDGYFAVTDPQGRFEIQNVPAGEPLEFQVWHESGGAAGKGLVGTTPDAADVKWSPRGRFVLQLQPDEQKEIKVVVPQKAVRL
jgi:hypothetical protein